ncbi:MAG TPA: DNA repair protein RecN [Cyclobacteriaceae bacterium]|nr:DNA repair protein RecN [Cyclobacteriaceae bacterium]
MLSRLHIKNYALIKDLELHPAESLNVITGETGAGKSIMLGAVALLLGSRADTKVLLNENEKCVAEAEFNIKAYALEDLFAAEDLDYDDPLIIRREINPNGKSRAFVNDSPVTLDVLKKIGAVLMDIHSQHETLQLSKQVYQLKLIDAYAQNANLLKTYQSAWQNYQHDKQAYEKLLQQSEKIKAEADFIRFQFDELDKAELEEGEQVRIEAALQVAENAEEIKLKLSQVAVMLGQDEFSVISHLSQIKSALQSIAGYAEAYENIFKRIESSLIELNDIETEISKAEAQIDYNEAQTQALRERISLIYQLLKKHSLQNADELIQLREKLSEQTQQADNLDEHLENAKRKLLQSEKEVAAEAVVLSKARQKVFTELGKKIVALLYALGMPDASFKVVHQNIAPSPAGVDEIDFYFSANKGIAPAPMASVASGGEFSRLMFCIKYVLAEKTAMPTIIFDEIDTGVSGEIALKLGRMMKEMSGRHQVIAISHLPQIAAKAAAHYFVFKDSSDKQTISRIRQLDAQQHIEEIAKMIAGEKPSEAAIKNAKELILN